ncbi:unnamed protein product [Globisporangium polare]
MIIERLHKMVCEGTIRRALHRARIRSGVVVLMFEPHGSAEAKEKLLELVTIAIVSLDLCVFSFSSDELFNAICTLKDKIRVRILADETEAAKEDSKIRDLVREGFTVKICPSKSASKDHPNSFCLIDKNIRIGGSLEWTREGLEESFASLDVRYKIVDDAFKKRWKTCHLFQEA